MPTKRLPGDRTAREKDEDVACVVVPTLHIFDCGQTVGWISLVGPRDPLALELAAVRDGVTLYRAAYRELRKKESHRISRLGAQAIAAPRGAMAHLFTSRTAIVSRRAQRAAPLGDGDEQFHKDKV